MWSQLSQCVVSGWLAGRALFWLKECVKEYTRDEGDRPLGWFLGCVAFQIFEVSVIVTALYLGGFWQGGG